MILITEQDHQQNHKDYLNMPMKTMMTMPAMSTGKRPEKAKAAIARSVLVGTWFIAILRMRTIIIIVIMMMIDIEIMMKNNSLDLKSYRRQIDDLGQIFHPSPQSPALSGGNISISEMFIEKSTYLIMIMTPVNKNIVSHQRKMLITIIISMIGTC